MDYWGGQRAPGHPLPTPMGRDISFPIFIRKDYETRKLERKSKQQISRLNDLLYRNNKSLNRYKIEWKLKQEKQNGH